MLLHDKPAFLSTVARSSIGFYAAQKKLWRNLGGVRFSSYSLHAAWDRQGDLAQNGLAGAYPEADAVTLPVTEIRYRLAGAGGTPAVEDDYYTFTRERGRWSIAADNDFSYLGFASSRNLWDFGRVRTERSRHFLLLYHPCGVGTGCVELPGDILTLAERGLAQVRRVWPHIPAGRIPIVSASRPGELSALLDATLDPKKYVAFAYSTTDEEHGLANTGARIVLSPEALVGRSSAVVEGILAHELVHVVTRRASGPFVPVFIEEGLADYVGFGDAGTAYVQGLASSGQFTGTLPRDDQFQAGDRTSINNAYQEGESAVAYFINRYGPARFRSFYRTLGRARIVFGTARRHVDEALRRATGAGYSAFERAWAGSIAP